MPREVSLLPPLKYETISWTAVFTRTWTMPETQYVATQPRTMATSTREMCDRAVVALDADQPDRRQDGHHRPARARIGAQRNCDGRRHARVLEQPQPSGVTGARIDAEQANEPGNGDVLRKGQRIHEISGESAFPEIGGRPGVEKQHRCAQQHCHRKYELRNPDEVDRTCDQVQQDDPRHQQPQRPVEVAGHEFPAQELHRDDRHERRGKRRQQPEDAGREQLAGKDDTPRQEVAEAEKADHHQCRANPAADHEVEQEADAEPGDGHRLQSAARRRNTMAGNGSVL